jgi:antitoxin component of RelBE/YafQ-DinJ toxin-antitoxin module
MRYSAHISCAHLSDMNITLSVDEKVAKRARAAALSMGKSLNQAVRDYLVQLAGDPQLDAQLAALEQSALKSPGRLKGWKFNRDEANQRA